MSEITLPFFGTINPEEDFFEITASEGAGQEVNISIDFEGEKPSDGSIETIKTFLLRLPENTIHVKQQMLSSDFSGEVLDYMEHHMSALEGAPELKGIESVDAFVNALKIQNVHIYPAAEDRFFSFDFTIGAELTQYLLVVDLSNELGIAYITTES